MDFITYYLLFCFLIGIISYFIRPRAEKKYYVNGYKIIYNSFYKTWQTSHDEIGVCEEFKTLKEAKEYCRKG